VATVAEGSVEDLEAAGLEAAPAAVGLVAAMGAKASVVEGGVAGLVAVAVDSRRTLELRCWCTRVRCIRRSSTMC